MFSQTVGLQFVLLIHCCLWSLIPQIYIYYVYYSILFKFDFLSTTIIFADLIRNSCVCLFGLLTLFFYKVFLHHFPNSKDNAQTQNNQEPLTPCKTYSFLTDISSLSAHDMLMAMTTS